MPRRPRVFVAGAMYHVYCQVARGKRAFADAREAAALLEVIREVKRAHGLSVLAWCVMPTHYHLAVRPGRVPLWRSMRLIQGRFARGYNRRHRVLGPFWQGRYNAVVVPAGGYLAQLIAYIHLNPVATERVQDPARYRWSGHRELLGRLRNPLADVDEALALFGSRRPAARRVYVRTLRGARKTAWLCERTSRLPWWPGTEDKEHQVGLGRDVVQRAALGASTVAQPPRWGVEEYLPRACGLCGMKLEDLSGRRRDSTISRLRELVTLVGVEEYGLRVKDLAERLRMNPGSVSRVLARASEREREDGSFHHQRLSFERRLAKLAAGATTSNKVRT